MNPTTGGLDYNDPKKRQKDAAAELARQKVLSAYYSDAKKVDGKDGKKTNQTNDIDIDKLLTRRPQNKAYSNLGKIAQKMFDSPSRPATKVVSKTPTSYKSTPINGSMDFESSSLDGSVVDWRKYHSAWQLYYQKYYSDYYAKAANQYLEEERQKIPESKTPIITDQPVDPTDEEEKNIFITLREKIRSRAEKENKRTRRYGKFFPIIAGVVAVLLILFLQYNRMIFAPIMAYVSPGNTSDNGITEIDPTITKAVGPDNRLIIPKLNVDVPVHFGVSGNDTDAINAAMENGVTQFSIPGASALPGQIGNLVISGHSAGDIYSNNQYKFIFSGLERLSNGDLLYIDYNGTRYTYSVTKMETVEPTNVAALVYETTKPMLTLVTCTPLGTSRYRLLVSAEQISPTPSGATQQQEYVDDGTVNEESMPENEPTFFERIWNWLTGNN